MNVSDTARSGLDVESLRRRIEQLEQELRILRQARASPSPDCAMHTCACGSLSTHALLGVHGEILDASPPLLAQLGYTRQDVVGRPVMDFVCPASREQAQAMLARSLSDQPTPEIEVDLIGRSGVQTFLLAPGHVPCMVDGRLRGILVSGTDITDRKRAEEALRDSEEKYRALAESMQDIVVAVDEEGYYLYLNAFAAQAAGGRPGDIIGKKVHDVFPAPFADMVVRQARQVITSGQPRASIDRLCLGGRMGWFHRVFQPLRDSQGRTNAALLVSRDITEQKEAQEQLQHSYQVLRTVLESLTENVGVVDRDGRYVFINENALAAMRTTREQVIGSTITQALGHWPGEAALWGRRVETILRSGESLGGEDRSVLEGQAFWFEWSVAPLRDAAGRVAGAVLRARDITERKRAEEALRQSQDMFLSAREEERRRLASELHDCLGQGLVALHLSLQGALSDLGASAAPPLVQAVQTCGELIREVRCISHGLYPPTLESLGLASALRQLVAYCRSANVEAGLACAGLAEGQRFGQHVEIAFFRIAQEAVQNALRHGRATRVRLSLAWQAGKLDLSITDNGAGFDVKASGAGLGLLTMKDRARAVGGRLDITSRPGRTRIRLRAQSSG